VLNQMKPLIGANARAVLMQPFSQLLREVATAGDVQGRSRWSANDIFPQQQIAVV
jgi:hypothetical protein